MPFTGRLSTAALSFCLLLAACSPTPRTVEMMPAPVAYDGAVAPFGNDDGASESGGAQLDMLYVTNRAPSGGGDEEPYYTGERGYLLRAGVARIDFGDSSIDWKEARQISLLKNRPGQFPLAVAGVSEYGIIPDSVSAFTPLELAASVDSDGSRRFLDAIEQRLARSETKDIYLYVHGYKVTYENPLLIASELWHFLGNNGAFIAFSWPSTPARLAYMKDIETARASAWGLRKLVEYLARNTSAARIHIVGYSAGSRVVLTTLYELALMHGEGSDDDVRRTTRLGNVILVGSDVDTGLFASYILDGLLRVQEHLTLYTSPSDQALHLSEKVFDHRRLGEIRPGTLDDRMRQFVASTDRLTFIDVAGAANFDEGNGHAYFRKSPWVSSDVLMNLRYGLGPAERGLERAGDSPIWHFPPDYLQRFNTALSKQNPDWPKLSGEAGSKKP